jgi:hypothetical protein
MMYVSCRLHRGNCLLTMMVRNFAGQENWKQPDVP